MGHWSVRPLLHAQNRSILVTPPFDLEEVAVELAFKEEDLEQIRKDEEPTLTVVVQGKTVNVSEIRYRTIQANRPKRGPIVTFSAAARRRMLERVATIDWQSQGAVLFVTLTCPPSFENHTMKERSVHRAVFNRAVEKHLGGPVGSLWRVEWAKRLSGPTEGQIAPHIHNLYFGIRFVSKRWVAATWGKAIGCMTPCIVDVQRCDKEKKIQVYIAKYISKAAEVLLLDNVSYRNKTGRHAGVLRKKLIPWCPGSVFKVRTQAVVEFLQRRAMEVLPHFDARYGMGFTMLGDLAIELQKDLAQFILDGSIELVYTY